MTRSLLISATATVRPVQTEIIAPQKAADHLCLIETPEDAWVEQLEALARWHSREIDAIHARTKTATLVPDLEGLDFRVTIVLLSEQGVPVALPTEHRHVRGQIESILRPRYVRLWEMDPRPMLETGSLAILPWIALMRKDNAALEAAAQAVRASGDRDLAARFVTVGSLRHERTYLIELLKGAEMLLYTKEVVEATPIGHEIREEGREEGRLEGQVSLLRSYLRRRFPALVDLPELDEIRSSDQAEALLLEIAGADSEVTARTAILRTIARS